MSTASEFFRHCPSCGRRFHIKLVSKKLTNERKDTEEVKQGMINFAATGYPRGSVPSGPVIVEENIPVTIDIEDFQYSYKCKHCGHEWFETRTKVSTA